MHRAALLSLALLAMHTPSQDPLRPSDPEPGISRALARARANSIDNVEYDLCVVLENGTEEVEGWVEIRFDLNRAASDGAIVLDFDGRELDSVRVNDQPPSKALRRINGHVLLPAESLVAGANRFSARFTSKVAPTGTPLTVYRDPADGAEYYYTLVVPADAHRLFPCFDQPDLKARVRMTLDIPEDWVAVANGPEVDAAEASSLSRGVSASGQLVHFGQTQPISTYLMAFAAGPMAVTSDSRAVCEGKPPLRIFHRRSRAAEMDAERLMAMHRDGLAWLVDYFAVDYPFAKLDIALIPGFPYGGMEHAGAIFYRERSLVFDTQPTESELTRRSTLIYHELSHQWFGNLVTMEWFDDLWLKEGFATFISYRCMHALEPDRWSWLRFHQQVKPRAYQVDATTGTTPVFQSLANLADAKSAYGAIVYNKAPAVLRQLDAMLGEERFRDGMTRFLERHAFDNARWQDLVTALDEQALGEWSARWILAPGMPQVTVQWTLADGVVSEAWLDQRPVHALGGEGHEATPAIWPLQLEVLVWPAEGPRTILEVTSDAARAPLSDLVGRPPPRCVLLNPADEAYGQFLVDSTSRDFLVRQVAREPDHLIRAVALSALWDTVREAQMDPLDFATLAADLLVDERDPESFGWLLDRLASTLERYLPAERGAPVRQRVSDALLARLAAGLGDRAVPALRFVVRHGSGPKVLELCARTAAGEAPPDVDLGRRDRFLASARLLAEGDATALDRLAAELADEDVAKDVYMARAAAATPEAKALVFESYLALDEPPEQWMQDSLNYFHWPGQSALTLPFLERALDRLDWVKQNRKIFFMPAWIDSFVNGHHSQEALDVVEGALARDDLSEDIRRKLLQSADTLQRSVRIRKRW